MLARLRHSWLSLTASWELDRWGQWRWLVVSGRWWWYQLLWADFKLHQKNTITDNQITGFLQAQGFCFSCFPVTSFFSFLVFFQKFFISFSPLSRTAYKLVQKKKQRLSLLSASPTAFVFLVKVKEKIWSFLQEKLRFSCFKKECDYPNF